MTGSTPEGSAGTVLALIGASGMLARAVARQALDHYQVRSLDLPDFDVTNRSQVLDVLQPLRPTVIINCAAFTDVDRCEAEEHLASRVNGDGPGYLAEAAVKVEALLVHISTDYVFDGQAREPYREDSEPNPLSAYGRSKLRGEQAILASGLERHYILRTGWLYGPGGRNFVDSILNLASKREALEVVDDQVGSPTYTADLAEALFRLLACPGAGFGIYHAAGAGHCSWHRFAEAILNRRVVPVPSTRYPRPAVRPAWSVLSCDRFRSATGWTLPPWEDGLRRYLEERATMEPEWREAE